MRVSAAPPAQCCAEWGLVNLAAAKGEDLLPDPDRTQTISVLGGVGGLLKLPH
jgi:hypothetical protein